MWVNGSLTTDTGFDVICCSCLQYKNVQNCKQIDLLSANQQKKFLIKPCFLLKNRNDAFYVCVPCKLLIDKNQMGIYRDDSSIAVRIPKREQDNLRKRITKVFKDFEFNITINIGLR